MSSNTSTTPSATVEPTKPGFREVWEGLPNKGMFFVLLAAWLALFQFLGNSTLGYVETPSLFAWLGWMYDRSVDDEHGWLVPIVVILLFWWKRDELLAVRKRVWWPGLVLLILGLGIHGVGYVIQQTRISTVGFFVGLYALPGIVWGPRFLAASFFPFFLFGFCVPLSGMTETVTFPLRVFASKVTAFIAEYGLGIHVNQIGTQIFDPNGQYQYEVAAACSGIRSLVATGAIAAIYAFVCFRSWWRRGIMMASAVPLAVAANVFRLTTIILASEAFGQSAGNWVHNSSWMSLLPYVPSILGVFLLGRWLSEEKEEKSGSEQDMLLLGERQES